MDKEMCRFGKNYITSNCTHQSPITEEPVRDEVGHGYSSGNLSLRRQFAHELGRIAVNQSSPAVIFLPI